MGRGKSGAGGGGGGGGSLREELVTEEKFHEFPDKPADGWSYYGDGKEAEEFFAEHSNADELVDGLDAYTIDAFHAWTRGSFMGGQQYEGWDGMSKGAQDMTRAFDRVLDRATLDEGIVVARRSDAQLVLGKGRKTATLEEMQAMEGRSVKSAGSMSTGAAEEGLTISFTGSHKPIEYRISIPGGTTGAGMWLGDRRINPGWGSEQREFMTNRDIWLKVGKSTYDATRGVIVTELLYTGRDKHDYGVDDHGKYRKRRGR